MEMLIYSQQYSKDAFQNVFGLFQRKNYLIIGRLTIPYIYKCWSDSGPRDEAGYSQPCYVTRKNI